MRTVLVALICAFSALCVADRVCCSELTVGILGINSADLPYSGQGVGIGQVEIERSGLPGFDDAAHSDQTTVPAAVFVGDGSTAPTPNSVLELSDHAQQVAGVMISTDPIATGVATDANLYSSGWLLSASSPLAAQHIALQQNDEVRAINMSFLEPSLPDGRSTLTEFVDWSASAHEVLYVTGIRNDDSANGFVAPSDNFNGMTVASSEVLPFEDVYRKVSSINDYSFEYDAAGERTSVDIIAPGVGVQVAAPGGARPIVQGSSYATPHVTGTVALLQEFGEAQITASVPNWTPNARRHQVMKAVLMNSADKLIDDGTVMVNGNAVPQGGLLGMERTVLKQDGTSTWLDSAAYDVAAGGGGVYYPLDDEMGVGHLNAKRAAQQFNPGEFNSDGADVPAIGWDYGTTTGEGDRNRYRFDQPFSAGHFISVTLAWDRNVEFATDNGQQGFFDIGDSFEDYQEEDPWADDVINDLDLWLLPRNSASTNQAEAYSIGIDGTVEHVFFQIPQTGEYEIWVTQEDQEAFGAQQDYALAWWYGLAPDIVTLSGDFDGNGTVDAADLAQWEGDFGLNGDSDADGDGDSDGADFLTWQRTYEGGPTTLIAGGSGGSALANEILELERQTKEEEEKEATPPMTAEDRFQSAKALIELAFSLQIIEDVTGDGWVDYEDFEIQLLALDPHPNLDVPRLLAEVRVTPYRLSAIAAVPEPASFLLGLIGLVVIRCRKRPQNATAERGSHSSQKESRRWSHRRPWGRDARLVSALAADCI